MLDVDEGSVFLRAFVAEDFNFVLQDFNTFFHFSQVLTRILNLAHVLVASVFDLLVERHELVEAEFNFLLFLCQIQNQQLLHFKLFLRLARLGRGLTCGASHFLADGG